jgi:hypothetical protein
MQEHAADPFGGPQDMNDPEVAIQPQSRPAPSEPASGEHGGTRGADGRVEGTPPREDQDQQDTADEPLPEFDPRWREEFSGLLYVGALTETFSWMGHEFVIRTLTTEELFTVALAVKPYEGTQAQARAWQAAVAAACVVSVDDQGLPVSITRDQGDHAVRFRYVQTNWHPPVIDAVFSRYWALETRVKQVVEAMGKATG